MDSNQRCALPYCLESVAVKWLGRIVWTALEPVGHGGPPALMPHRDFLETARTEKSDITLQALCHRLLAERAVKANTSMMSRFFRRGSYAEKSVTA
jgi:transposase